MKYAFLTLLLLNILYALWQWQERVPEAGPPASKTAEQAAAAPPRRCRKISGNATAAT